MIDRLVDLAVRRHDAKARQLLAMMGLLVVSCAQHEPARPKADPAPSAPPAITRPTAVPVPKQPVPTVQQSTVATPTNEAPLPQLKARYEAKLRELDRTRDKSIADAPAQYRLYLQNLEKQFVDKGDLKGVVAVQNESNRFAKAGAVTTNDLVSTPEALLVAQRLMMGAPDSAERVRLKGRDDLNRYYFNALELLKVDLTKKARIQEALDVSAEVERIRPLVVPAPTNAIAQAAQPAKESPPERSEGSAKPVPEPASTKPAAPLLPASLKNGLVAFYPLNGTADDISGNHWHGRVTGAYAVASRFGEDGSALAFDKVDDKIDLDASISPKWLSICMWVKLRRDNDGAVLAVRNGFGYGIVQKDSDVSFSLRISSDRNQPFYSFSTPGVADDKWHHIAMTYGESGFIVYVDAVEKFKSTRLGSPPVYYYPRPDRHYAVQFCFGTPTGNDKSRQKMIVDNFAVWDRQLSRGEVMQVQALR